MRERVLHFSFLISVHDEKGGFMSDLNCLLAGLIRLFSPMLFLVLWHRKTGARFYPALIAFPICFPVFIAGAAIRSGFDPNDYIGFYIKQGILYGILEETAKYLALRFILTDYDSRKDAVTYGIGHSALEDITGGLTCLGLIGTDRAAPDILWVNLWTALEGIAFAAALTVLIFYGIRTDKSKIMLPAAILLHAFSNALFGLYRGSTAVVIGIGTLATAGVCYAAYRCWQAMKNPYED